MIHISLDMWMRLFITNILVYEEFQLDENNFNGKVQTIINYSSLLSPDPLLKSNIGSIEIFVCKYALLDYDI